MSSSGAPSFLGEFDRLALDPEQFRRVCFKHGVSITQCRRAYPTVSGIHSDAQLAVLTAGCDRDPVSGLTAPMLRRAWKALAEVDALSPDRRVLPVERMVNEYLSAVLPQFRPIAMARLMMTLLIASDRLSGNMIEPVEQRSRRSWQDGPTVDENGDAFTTDGRLLRTVPMWQSSRHWLAAVQAWLQTDAATRARGRRASVATVMEVATALVRFVDGDTGRHLTASHETIAESLSCKPSSVKAVIAILRSADLVVEVTRGRKLTSAEIVAARSHHGRLQVAVASESLLSVPRALAAVAVPSPLPSRSQFTSKGSVEKVVTKRASARVNSNSSEKSPKKPRGGGRKRFSLALHRLAGRLMGRMQGLDRAGASQGRSGPHMGQFVSVLAQTGVDPAVWTAADVVAALNQDARDNGIGWQSAPTNPAGYLAWRLSRIDLGSRPERVVLAERDRIERERTRAILTASDGNGSSESHRAFLLTNWRNIDAVQMASDTGPSRTVDHGESPLQEEFMGV